MHIAFAQHLFILSIRADEFFNLTALTLVERILGIAQHVLQFLDALFHAIEPHHLEFHLQLMTIQAVQLCGFGMHFRQACQAVHSFPFLLQRHNGCPDAADFFSRGLLLFCLIVADGLVELLHRVQAADILRLFQTGKGFVPLFL